MEHYFHLYAIFQQLIESTDMRSTRLNWTLKDSHLFSNLYIQNKKRFIGMSCCSFPTMKINIYPRWYHTTILLICFSWCVIISFVNIWVIEFRNRTDCICMEKYHNGTYTKIIGIITIGWPQSKYYEIHENCNSKIILHQLCLSLTRYNSGPINRFCIILFHKKMESTLSIQQQENNLLLSMWMFWNT